MAQLARLDDRANVVKQLFLSNNDRIIKAAPRQYDPQRLLTVAFNAIGFNEDLLKCALTVEGQASLMAGVMESIKMGLTLGGPMQEAHLVPFKGKATLIVGYQGYRNLIDRARATIDLHPRAVHHEDEFDFWFGDEPRILHRPKSSVLTEKDLKAVYCVARLRGGGKQMEVMMKDEVDAHRNRSAAKAFGPWSNQNDYVAMALKTVLRKVAKYLPKASIEIARALDLDERADRGVDQGLDASGIVTIDVTPNTEPGKGVLGKLTQSLTGKAPVAEMADADLDAEIAAQEK